MAWKELLWRATLNILAYLEDFKQSYAPEWGSGGIFGLKYHRGVLYFTLAMDAKAFFIDNNGVRRVYEFEKVGPKPVSGGDTYNAVEAVDGRIYFGGWVHAPAVYRGRERGVSTIDFRNKYSHVHYYDIDNDEVVLLWKESMHDPERWVGEVSEIIYNPYRDELLLGRADGHENLGVYSLNPRTGKAERIIGEPALKGSHHLDYACFAISKYPGDVEGVACIDLIERENIVLKGKPQPVDGEPVENMWTGPVASAYGWLFIFIRGGVLLVNIFENEYHHVRLFDIPGTQLAPLRTKSIYLGGGLLVAYNSYTHDILRVRTDDQKARKRYLGTIASPTLLLYITPPQAKVSATLGARVTSIERIGDKIVLGVNTMANTERYDASPFDQGVRGFTILSQDIIVERLAPIEIPIPGHLIRDKPFGGLPLAGYREPKLIIYSKKPNKITVKEYYLTLPPSPGEKSTVEVKPGRNTISLSGYSGIVSFKPEKPLGEEERVVIKLI
jgi:hypothetical protein